MSSEQVGQPRGPGGPAQPPDRLGELAVAPFPRAGRGRVALGDEVVGQHAVEVLGDDIEIGVGGIGGRGGLIRIIRHETTLVCGEGDIRRLGRSRSPRLRAQRLPWGSAETRRNPEPPFAPGGRFPHPSRSGRRTSTNALPFANERVGTATRTTAARVPNAATPGRPPAGPGWAFEFKWDGVRAVTAVAGSRVRAHSRRGNEITGAYPELADLPELLDGRPVLLDGEVVALDAAGRPDFGLLQHRMHVRSPAPELVERIPVSYVVFDLLHLDGRTLLRESYDRRRAFLDELGLAGARVRVPPATSGIDGEHLLEVARSTGSRV